VVIWLLAVTAPANRAEGETPLFLINFPLISRLKRKKKNHLEVSETVKMVPPLILLYIIFSMV
jgi:hypothetical protein